MHTAFAEFTMPPHRVASLLPWAVVTKYRLRRAAASLLKTSLGVAMAGRGRSTGASGVQYWGVARGTAVA